MPPGPHNAITDIAGVRVGHASRRDGDLRTGVTAVLPHGGNLYRDKVTAASAVLNGYGKSVGLMQIDALCAAETTTGRDGHVMPALPIPQTLALLKRHGVAVRT